MSLASSLATGEWEAGGIKYSLRFQAETRKVVIQKSENTHPSSSGLEGSVNLPGLLLSDKLVQTDETLISHYKPHQRKGLAVSC